MLESLKQTIEDNFSFRPNKNQFRDIERLTFEIMRREKIHLNQIIDYLKNNSKAAKCSGKDKFFAIKNSLLNRRFPLTTNKEKIDAKRIFLTQLKKPLLDKWQVNPIRDKSSETTTTSLTRISNGVNKEFNPLKVFVEKEVRKSYLVDNFKKMFPQVEMEELSYYSEYLKKNKFHISQLKKSIVFIVKEKWDFIKPCPCTKHHLSCGYWIFNLGFGCPFDCSYCFLQQYTNFPGLILPANLDDFFEKFDRFAGKLKKPIRIGTGEFCDSLALDDITQYSSKLIPYFKEKNVSFELKTKSTQIDNLLKIKSSPNIVISWSLNPPSIIEKEELATASLEERIEAAGKAQTAGFGVGFHFDPIIHFQDWKNQYKEVICQLYSKVKPPFAWISLGTLRSNRELKTIVESRFPQSNIFYGELLLGEDKKLRYPRFLRKEIYSKLIEWIREYDTKTLVYLCMENKEMWEILGLLRNTTAPF